MTIYTNIDSNKRRTVFLIIFFLIFIIGLGWALGYIFNIFWILPLAVFIAVFQALISYYYSDSITLAISKAIQVPRKEPYLELHRIVENLAITAGIPKPKIYLINDTAINAFATGRDPKHSSITLTAGALERLDKNELQGVISHEMSHIGNYDIRLMTIVVVLVGVVALISDFFLRSLWFRGNRRDNNQAGLILLIIGIALAILAPLAATLIQLAISRKREFLADANGALLTRYPEGLASALEKISHDQEPLEVANRATAHLYIANPFKGRKVSNLFSTHPPIEERIKALQEME
jgi:heat shock protein HtpX